MVLHPYERTIIDVLRRARRWLSTKEIAEYGGMSWQTAKKYVNRLYIKGKLRKKTIGKGKYYTLR